MADDDSSTGSAVSSDGGCRPMDVMFLRLLVEKAVLAKGASAGINSISTSKRSLPSTGAAKHDTDPMAMCREAIQEYLRHTAMKHSLQQQKAWIQPPVLGDVELDFFQAARQAWHRKIDCRLNLIITEHHMPLTLPSTSPNSATLPSREVFVDRTRPEPLKTSMFVYDHQDLLREYLALRNPNMREDAYAPLEFAGPRFATPSLSALRSLLHDLNPSLPQEAKIRISRRCWTQYNASPNQPSQATAAPFVGGKHKPSLPNTNHCLCPTLATHAMPYITSGCPVAQRATLWYMATCGADPNDYALKYDELWHEIRQVRRPVDHLLAADAKYQTNLDDNYFVFYDVILEVMIALIRDPALSSEYGCTSLGADVVPNGIVPFRGLCLFVAPLAFIYPRTPQLYRVFVKLYTRYFRLLHTLNEYPNGIARLSQTFLDLMQVRLPHLLLHLKGLGVNPLEIAFPWMFQAFSGYLLPEQVLLLWDRIIGFDTLHVLPLLSFALFAFRQRALAVARTKRDVEFVMADLRSIAVVPLMQYALFARDIATAA
ncbi:hypothetical protein PTSG_12280 [Salpingoeca rosetta]|uniref:Rab-GAP TBC domain-containing protein n=1 Tax=Salpingoeca rosetta (strain ATCC 50818 / BSB-021) TaxID=946362 RepID=F2UAW8_SALR5|nr:uncharacterized protein PTSG_12280 [Salpingoeca rosetta]EGD73534.1 hypothetical protein PTSG_12280 [Salpingoeca rosetta]|eukprot:XP_004993816.1 hypothetical protein PTSG_12280 [Salpingoeca rosetta]